MGPELILIFAWVITRSIFNYKVDREYARKGLDSPRYKVKMAKLAASGQTAAAGAAVGPARLGAKGYFRELWDDAWDDAHDRRQRIREEKKAGTYVSPSMGERAAGFGHWLWEGNRPADVVPPQTARPAAGGPAGSATPGGDPFAPAPTKADGPRYACPVCGDNLNQRDGAWRHPEGSTCTSAAGQTTGGPKPATSGTARGTARVPAGSRRAVPKPDRRPSAPDPLLAAAHAALAETDPQGTGRLRAMHDAWDLVYKAQPGADPHLIDAAIHKAQQSPRCLECGQPAYAKPPCEHRKAAHARMQQSAREALTRLTPPAGAATDNKTNGTTHNGGATMPDTDLLTYNQAVAEHEAALQHLLTQRAEAVLFKQHLTGSTANVEAMDAGRVAVAQALAPLAEGMEGSRFGADASAGSAEAAGALTAGSIGAVQEHIEAANATNDRWITELDAAIEAVQASLQHVKSTLGEAAAAVQETGVKGAALEEH